MRENGLGRVLFGIRYKPFLQGVYWLYLWLLATTTCSAVASN